MESVNKRFLEFYNYLIVQNSVKSAKIFAEIIGVSSSLVTELTKGRTNVGTKTIQNTVIHFNLNANWLLTGEGEMLKINNIFSEGNNKDLIDRICELSARNALLEADNERLKKDKRYPHVQHTASVAAEPELKTNK